MYKLAALAVNMKRKRKELAKVILQEFFQTGNNSKSPPPSIYYLKLTT